MAYQKIFIGPLVWKCSTNSGEIVIMPVLSLCQSCTRTCTKMYKNVQKCTKYVSFCLEVPWIDLSKPECQKLSYLVSRVLDLKDTATLQFTNLLFNYRSGILSEN